MEWKRGCAWFGRQPGCARGPMLHLTTAPPPAAASPSAQTKPAKRGRAPKAGAGAEGAGEADPAAKEERMHAAEPGMGGGQEITSNSAYLLMYRRGRAYSTRKGGAPLKWPVNGAASRTGYEPPACWRAPPAPLAPMQPAPSHTPAHV